MAGTTKAYFVKQAFAKLGYAAYIYDLMPEQLQAMLYMLDNMVAEWNAAGIMIGYPIAADPDSSTLDQLTNVPVGFNNAVIYNLAKRAAPDFGKVLSAEAMAIATTSYNALLTQAVFPDPMQYPDSTPAGSGNKPWRRTGNPFLLPVDDAIDANNGNILDFE